MPYAVVCSHCQGELIVEQLPATLPCPLCGEYLEVVADEGETSTESKVLPGSITAAASILHPTASAQTPPEMECSPHENELPSSELPSTAETNSAQQTCEATALAASSLTASVTPSVGSSSEQSRAPQEDHPWPESSLQTNQQEVETFTSELPFALTELGRSPVADRESLRVVNTTERVSPEQTSPQITSRLPETVPFTWFVIALSYASAITLVLVYLLLTEHQRRKHPLESLPDLVPETFNGQIAMKVPQPQAPVAPGHVLRLGESERYGSVRLTPLRITRGTLLFEHRFDPRRGTLPPVSPVLKLHLRFENVSQNQRFPPLDETLVFKRIYHRRSNKFYTNNFLTQEELRLQGGPLYFLYDLPEFSEFKIVGQNLGTVIGPGESFETFLPSQEAVPELRGECTWRVQFRKGYHPQSGRGVTTLIDVRFDAAEIVDESPTA
ncbi:MAG: hypothetical protein KatS3mg113_0662 [Planctomycetaceae bacterium]|nr:MAG: hypothetical protein KatS3mg113_0662 [Planctomycetaceae bacterium]